MFNACVIIASLAGAAPALAVAAAVEESVVSNGIVKRTIAYDRANGSLRAVSISSRSTSTGRSLKTAGRNGP
jgi:hypothetical protein